MPVNATLQVATAYRAVELMRLEGVSASRGVLASVDELVHEFRVKDETPNALGEVTLSTEGVVRVGSWATIEQTYTVGETPLGPGARIMAARHAA